MQNGNEITEVYYFPLTVTLFERTAYGNIIKTDDLDGRFAADYADEIADKLEEFTGNNTENPADYFEGSDSAMEKLQSLQWGVETVGDELYGTVTATLFAPLTESEEAELKDYITGQNSDGLGEDFEQRDIEIPEGLMSVHFWEESNDYEILNTDEFCARHSSPGLTMGGMS